MAKITAVIDIGSNSVRMQVFKKTSHFGFYLLDEIKSRARISEDSYQNNANLSTKAMQRTKDALCEFIKIAKYYKARKILCVATSAVRDAPNKDEFLSLVKKSCALNIKVISGEKEAFLGGVAASNLLPIDSGITMDIGGGSTEFALIENKNIKKTFSLQLGTVRLKELFFDNNKSIIDAKKYIQNELSKLPSNFHSQNIIGFGGTLRALAKSIIKKEKYPLNILHGFKFSLEDNQKYIDSIFNTKKPEELKKFGFKTERLDVIREGALIFSESCKKLMAKEIIISGAGVREGVFLSDMLRNSSLKFPANFNPSVRSLVDRFEINTKEANFVAKVASKIFDVLEPLHNIPKEYKKYLIVSSKISEIGNFINFYKKSLHAYNIVFEGLDYGFWHHERVLIAKIIKNQDKNAFYKYSPPGKLKQFLPQNQTIKWLCFMLFLARELNKDKTFPEINFSYEKETLIIISNSSFSYLLKESLKNIHSLIKINLKEKNYHLD